MNASSPSDTPVVRQAPWALWRFVEAFMHTLFNLFGGPEHVAARHTLNAKAHALLSAWIRAGETLMRHLLLIEAAALGSPAPARRSFSEGGSDWRASSPRQRRLREFTADKPEDWRVSFATFTTADRWRLPAEASAKAGPAGKPADQPAQACESGNTECRLEAGGPLRRRFLPAWPLAERYEALLRVFNDPAPYAARLARKLHATPERIQEVLTHTEATIDRIGRVAFEEIRAATRAATPAFNSS